MKILKYMAKLFAGAMVWMAIEIAGGLGIRYLLPGDIGTIILAVYYIGATILFSLFLRKINKE